MSREDRKKASEVFRDTNFVFGEKVAFREAFPAIAHVVVRYRETGAGTWHGRGDGWSERNETELGEFIDCSNSLCYNGGYRVGSILRSMVSQRATKQTTSCGCQGYEGSPKGRRKYRSCFNHIDLEIRIEYRPDAPTAE